MPLRGLIGVGPIKCVIWGRDHATGSGNVWKLSGPFWPGRYRIKFSFHDKIILSLLRFTIIIICQLTAVLFLTSAVLEPRLATPWAYFSIYLSYVCHYDWLFFTRSRVHVLTLSIRAVRGLPRLRAPVIVPFIISFSWQLSCFFLVWP